MAMMKPLLLSTALLVSLTACETMPWREFNTGDPVRSSMTTKQQKTDFLESARQMALENRYPEIRNGQLAAAEEAYTKAPHDADAALAYAKLLRRVNMVEQANMVLTPFARYPETATEDMLVEYAKVKLALGQLDEAQMMAQEAGFKANTASSLMVLGVALDAQGHHVAAEGKFREALQNVGMDIDLRNKILNNLSISLMGQGRQEEAKIALSQISDVAGGSGSVVDANRKLANNL